MKKMTTTDILNPEDIASPLAGLMLIPMSWSRLDCYEWCAKQYKFKYWEKRSEGWSMPLAIGNAVHTTLENAIKFKADHDSQIIGWYLGALDDLDPGHLLSSEEILNGKEMAVSAWRLMINLVPDYKSVIDVEWGFLYVIGAGLFNGYIDLIFWDEDENGPFIHIVDYKTGNNYDKKGKKKKHTKKHGQTKLYTIAVKRAFPDTRVKASLYWTKHKEIDTHEYTDDELNEFRDATRNKVADIIEDEKMEPTRADVKCGYCTFAKDGSCSWGIKAVERWDRICKARARKAS